MNGKDRPKPDTEEAGEIFHPLVQRMAAFRQATLRPLWLDPAKTRQTKRTRQWQQSNQKQA